MFTYLFSTIRKKCNWTWFVVAKAKTPSLIKTSYLKLTDWTGKNKCSKNRILLSFVPKSPQYSLCIIATMKWTSGLLVFLYFLSDVKGLFKSRQIKVEETVQDQSCVKQFLGVQTKPYPQRYIPREVGCCHKIVGGQEVCRRYPWVLGLWRNWGSRPFCGGSLINDRWMLTGGPWSF